MMLNLKSDGCYEKVLFRENCKSKLQGNFLFLLRVFTSSFSAKSLFTVVFVDEKWSYLQKFKPLLTVQQSPFVLQLNM